MSDQNLFEESNSPETQEQSTSNDNLFSNQLADIKNEEGKQKYASLEEALKGLKNSQEYIPQLKDKVSEYESEITKLKAELEKRKSVEEAIGSLSNTNDERTEDQSSVTKLDESTVESLVAKILSERDSNTTKTINKNKVNTALVSKFGDKAKEVLLAKANEMNTDIKTLGVLSETNPDMVLALFSASQSSSKPMTSSYNLPQTSQQEELKRPEKSLLFGASSKEQMEYMKQIKEAVYKKYDVKSN